MRERPSGPAWVLADLCVVPYLRCLQEQQLPLLTRSHLPGSVSSWVSGRSFQSHTLALALGVLVLVSVDICRDVA